MAFVDELNIHIKAGNGGDGVVRWLTAKGKPQMGPAGGDGGRGGDVYIRGSRDLGLLFNYRNKKDFEAEDGVDGGKKSLIGRGGEDMYLDLPIGSLVTNKRTRRVYELLEDGQVIKILEGGVGGFGNEHFKSSTRQAPDFALPGRDGEEADFHIELQLIASIGLVGFPNAGKSTLLNEITNADAKIGNYAFTTLEPNLGVTPSGHIVADIPGLIEGASDGKGLGDKFLRHIRRTKVLFHLVSVENENAAEAYTTIRKELESFDESLLAKDEYIFLSKSDISEEEVEEKKKELEKTSAKEVFILSMLDEDSVKQLDKIIRSI